jgi:hypothetical protein
MERKATMSKKHRSVVQRALDKIARHGVGNTLHLVGLKLVNLVLPLKILRGVYVERPDAAFLESPEEYRAGFLPARTLGEFAQDPATELSPEFVEQALEAGDECYAFCDGAKLAAYGWYSTRPTPVGSPELLLKFAERYVYMYKGFTGRDYRGKRLHAIGMTLALQHYLVKGYGGIVSYVESTNLDSLKSCFRMGYAVFGSIYLVSLFGRTFAFSSPGCRRFDFRVEREPAAVAGLQRRKT